MIHAVWDTNVLASGAVARSGPVAEIIDAWRRGHVRVVVSAHILGELDRALRNAYFAARLDAQRRDAFFALVRANVALVTITAPVPSIAETRADNLVLPTAASAGTPYLVTGDRELLRLGQYEETAIRSPRQFLEVLGSGAFD